MKLEFCKNVTARSDSLGHVTESFYIHIDIAAVPKHEEKIAYAVQNMAYSLGYRMTKKEAEK